MYKNAYYENYLIIENIIIKENKNKITLQINNQQNKNSININHITELFKLKCWTCHQFFQFNNKLHKYLWSDCHYYLMKTTLNLSKITNQLMIKTLSVSVQQTLTLLNLFIYVKFIITNQFNSDEYRFQDWHYITAEARLSSTIINQSICLDTECIMTLIDRTFLIKQTSYIKTHHISSFISIWKLKFIVHSSDKYIKMNIYLSEINDHTVIMTQEIHIVNDFCAKMLVSIDILVIKDIIMNLFKQTAIIDSCANIKVFFIIIIKFISQIHHIIIAKEHIIISL